MNPLIFVKWWLLLRHRHNFEIDPSASSIVDVSPPCWLRQTQRLWRPTSWSYPQQNRRTRRGARNPRKIRESVENVVFLWFLYAKCRSFDMSMFQSYGGLLTHDHWLLYEYILENFLSLVCRRVFVGNKVATLFMHREKHIRYKQRFKRQHDQWWLWVATVATTQAHDDIPI